MVRDEMSRDRPENMTGPVRYPAWTWHSRLGHRAVSSAGPTRRRPPRCRDPAPSGSSSAALGFFWGSSYLFIKIGVETLHAVHPDRRPAAFGCALLGASCSSSAREPLPRIARSTPPDRHGRAQHRDPVLADHLGRDSRSIRRWPRSSTPSAPLFTILIASLVLAEEPITVNRLVGLIVGFGGVLVLSSRGLGEGTVELPAGRARARRCRRSRTPSATSSPGPTCAASTRWSRPSSRSPSRS